MSSSFVPVPGCRRIITRRCLTPIAIVCGAALSLVGLQVAAQAVEVPPVISADAPKPAYRFARGDELNLKFFYTPELNTIAIVRPDGNISIPLIGDLRVEGMSASELSSAIVTRLGSAVRRPEVSINVQNTQSQRVFIGGEVTRPGVQTISSALSLIQAVVAAEGLKDTARSRSVVVIRRGPQGERQVIEVDLQAALDGRDMSQDVALQPADVVVVPRSGVASVNLWVDQYIRRNLPISVGYSFNAGTGALK